jgi:hypothetical protein
VHKTLQKPSKITQNPSETGSNPAKRKELFSRIVLDRSKGFCYIVDVINQVKE